METTQDDASTLVSIADTEATLLADDEIREPCHFLNLSVELRKKIFRFSCISDIDHTSHPRLWRATGNRLGWIKIGYFGRDTVIPLLLLSRQLHDEVAAGLYGENVFAFHVSVLSQGPILFFSWLAPRYVRLLRKVYIRSGFNVDTYDLDYTDCYPRRPYDCAIGFDRKRTKDLATSAGLVKQAWPQKFNVRINKTDTLLFTQEDNLGIWRKSEANDWPIGSYHLWKMIVTKVDDDEFSPEFRRITMVESEYRTSDIDC